MRLRAEVQLHGVLLDALETRYSADKDQLRQYTSRAKRLTYSSTIVGCYGVIEQTVDSALMALAEAYGRIYPTFGDVPEKVRLNHRDLVLQCLRDGDRARTRQIVDGTAATRSLLLVATDRPALTTAVFTLSTANYRMDYLKSLFARIGLDIGDALSKGQPVEYLDKTGFANFESFLSDLVQRRNDLAHSYGDDAIIDMGVLGAYVEVVGCLLRAIILAANHAVVSLLSDWQLQSIGTVVRTWTGRIGIELKAGELAVGDRLLVVKGNWCTSHEVGSLFSNDREYDRVEFGGTSLDVAAGVRNVPAGAESADVYVIDGTWSEFWPLDTKNVWPMGPVDTP
ncbi:MAE_28990/MAE_18760 family HEPN-like nuclease [Tsukamurella tyrosinosolvens]|uniref:MAE_28990/MAE_18760 family HEPN-like nuclease n=1 Tax=Tsukamurella tyrosinosolvens TaxID=57704 RepID=UPI0012E807C9